jgi:hypothetical protein
LNKKDLKPNDFLEAEDYDDDEDIDFEKLSPE